MNRLLMLAGLLVLAGCATDTAGMRDGTAAQAGPAEAYVQAVERQARIRGVNVHWLHRPEGQPAARMARH